MLDPKSGINPDRNNVCMDNGGKKNHHKINISIANPAHPPRSPKVLKRDFKQVVVLPVFELMPKSGLRICFLFPQDGLSNQH
jgi:hypothetical protein